MLAHRNLLHHSKPDKSTRRHQHAAPHSTRDGDKLLEDEVYLDSITCDDDHCMDSVCHVGTRSSPKGESGQRTPCMKQSAPDLARRSTRWPGNTSRICFAPSAEAFPPRQSKTWSKSSEEQICSMLWLKLTNALSVFLKPSSLLSSFQFRTWNGSTRSFRLEMSQPIPGVWCMAQRSQELLQP